MLYLIACSINKEIQCTLSFTEKYLSEAAANIHELSFYGAQNNKNKRHPKQCHKLLIYFIVETPVEFL